jgi:hypothetical protein
MFTTTPEALRSGYERLPDLLGPMRRDDPAGKFCNGRTGGYRAG